VHTKGKVIVCTTSLERAELKRDQIHAYGPDPRIERCAGSMSATIEPAEWPLLIGPPGLLDDDVRLGHVLREHLLSTRSDVADLVHHIHPVDHPAERRVLVLVQERVVDGVDEELRSRAIEVLRPGHGNVAALVRDAVARLVLDWRVRLSFLLV